MAKKKILIVEDHHDERLAMNVQLKSAGYETCFATDGISSIAEAEKHRPDLILLDIGMPAGDGFVVMERLQNIPELAAIPVIVVSVSDSREYTQRTLDAGAKMFFQKPADKSELLTSVRHWLGDTAIEPAVYDI